MSNNNFWQDFWPWLRGMVGTLLALNKNMSEPLSSLLPHVVLRLSVNHNCSRDSSWRRKNVFMSTKKPVNCFHQLPRNVCNVSKQWNLKKKLAIYTKSAGDAEVKKEDVLTCTWCTCSMEKSLLKQELSIGMDEGWTASVPPGGEPPPWRALSRESSVPLEFWFTGSQSKHILESLGCWILQTVLSVSQIFTRITTVSMTTHETMYYCYCVT